MSLEQNLEELEQNHINCEMIIKLDNKYNKEELLNSFAKNYIINYHTINLEDNNYKIYFDLDLSSLYNLIKNDIDNLEEVKLIVNKFIETEFNDYKIVELVIYLDDYHLVGYKADVKAKNNFKPLTKEEIKTGKITEMQFIEEKINLPKEKVIDLYLDDLRNPGNEWVIAKNVNQAIYALRRKEVNEISLDNDLGNNLDTGYQLLVFMEYKNIWPNKIFIHSSNSSGVKDMKRKINKTSLYKQLGNSFIKIK